MMLQVFLGNSFYSQTQFPTRATEPYNSVHELIPSFTWRSLLPTVPRLTVQRAAPECMTQTHSCYLHLWLCSHQAKWKHIGQ